MKKELFTKAEVEIILLDRLDVITDSCTTDSCTAHQGTPIDLGDL